MTAVLDGTLEAPAARAGGSAGQPPAERYPARRAVASWAAACQGRRQVLDLVDTASSALPESRVQANRRRGLPLLLDWLEGQPGRPGRSGGWPAEPTTPADSGRSSPPAGSGTAACTRRPGWS